MPTFYEAYNRRNIISAPDYNRSRHAYRSPRSSYSINLEAEQFRYSILKLNARQDALQTKTVTNGVLLTEGGSLSVKYNSEVNPDEELEGIETLAARLADARRRIEELERVL